MNTNDLSLVELEKLREFKNYVHKRLDEIGVPRDPEPANNAKHGCRIEGRLNFLQKMIEPPVTVDYLSMVSKFHRLFQHPVLDTPQIPPKNRCDLRRNLIREEFKELEVAIEVGDIIAVADALCDLQYVLSGTVLEFGLKEKFPLMFDEVQRSNMSKACNTEQEAKETIEEYRLMGEVWWMHYEEKDGKFLVYRTEDRKTLKSINYSPANLKQFI